MLPDPPQRRIRVTVAYDGTEFHGWQVQPGLVTIQGTLQSILRRIEGHDVAVHGSGRTDAGVHAQAQVAAFSLTNPIPAENLRRAINRLLPPAIRVVHTEEAPLAFHPRFDAIAKTYEYRLFRGEVCPPEMWRYVHHFPYPLNVADMQACARLFEGEHDFSSFCASGDHDARMRSRVRRIFSSRLEMRGGILFYSVRGSGFLKHMVRRITGTLLESGKGNLTASGVRRLLDGSALGPSAHSAPAKGLHLMSVEYPQPDTL